MLWQKRFGRESGDETALLFDLTQYTLACDRQANDIGKFFSFNQS
jgi:hypothetical protein